MAMDGSATKIRPMGDSRPWDEELRAWLEAYMSAHPHLTPDRLASSDYLSRREPVSPALITQYVQGKYFLPKELGGQGVRWTPENKIERVVRAFRQDVESELYLPAAQRFEETDTWRRVQYACDLALREGCIVVIYGHYGVGKSRSLAEFCDRHMRSRPVSVLCSGVTTARSLTATLAERMRVSPRGSLAQVLDRTAERFRSLRRPLFVDQANYLDRRAISCITHIWEVAKPLGVVLAGTPTLYDTLVSPSALGTSDERGQLTSRIRFLLPVGGLSVEEVHRIVAPRMEGWSERDSQILHEVVGGNHRRLAMCLNDLAALWARHRSAVQAGRYTPRQIIERATDRLLVDGRGV